MATAPSRTEQLRNITADLLSGNPSARPSDLYHLDADQALDWIKTDPNPRAEMYLALSEAIGEAQHKGHIAALNCLTPALLGDITADQLLELRDVLRAVLIEGARREVVWALEKAHLFDEVAA